MGGALSGCNLIYITLNGCSQTLPRIISTIRTRNNSRLVFRVAGGWVLFKYRPQSKNAYVTHKNKFKILLLILNLQIWIFHEKDSNFCGHVQVGDFISRRDGRSCHLSSVTCPCTLLRWCSEVENLKWVGVLFQI